MSFGYTNKNVFRLLFFPIHCWTFMNCVTRINSRGRLIETFSLPSGSMRNVSLKWFIQRSQAASNVWVSFLPKISMNDAWIVYVTENCRCIIMSLKKNDDRDRTSVRQTYSVSSHNIGSTFWVLLLVLYILTVRF